MKKIFFIRAALILLIIFAGSYAVMSAPKAVKSFLPKVDTITLERADYCETVSGSGTIAHYSGGKWVVRVAVGERDIRKVKVGQTAEISGAAFDDGIYTATVTEIDGNASRKQGDYAYETVVDVKLVIDNPDGELRSGYTARAEIKTEEERGVFIIPYSVIRQDDAGEYVFVLSGNSAVRRDIVTGAELAEGAEVLSGLSGSDEIIASPENLTDRALVVKNSPPAD